MPVRVGYIFWTIKAIVISEIVENVFKLLSEPFSEPVVCHKIMFAAIISTEYYFSEQIIRKQSSNASLYYHNSAACV